MGDGVNIIIENGANVIINGGISHGNLNQTLTFWAQSNDPDVMGSLTATAAEAGHAGIGGHPTASGTITINGGRITATGGATTVANSGTGAGIGGGGGSNGTNNGGFVNINGGIVTATGGFANVNAANVGTGAGIGGGGGSNGGGSSNTMNLTGGTIIATGGGSLHPGASFGAGIGGGGTGSGTAGGMNSLNLTFTNDDGTARATSITAASGGAANGSAFGTGGVANATNVNITINGASNGGGVTRWINATGNTMQGTVQTNAYYNGYTTGTFNGGGRFIKLEASFPSGGVGTAGNPYIINTEVDLVSLASLANDNRNFGAYRSAHYRLENNLDLSGYASGQGWVPIGTATNQFTGTFNGNGKTITGLTINRPAVAGQGLFGFVGTSAAGGSISNLGLVNVNINGGAQTGGIAGDLNNASSIDNCFVSGTVNGGVADFGNNVGGIAGQLQGTSSVRNCYSIGTVTGFADFVGGIAGQIATGARVENCWSAAAVSGGYTTGGIVGGNSNSGVVQNNAALNVSVTGTEPGANVGRVIGTGSISNASGNIAFAGMTGGNFGSIPSNAIHRNGRSVASEEIIGGTAFDGMFTGTMWTKGTGKLPGFGAALDMPGHLLSCGDCGGCDVCKGSFPGDVGSTGRPPNVQSVLLFLKWYNDKDNTVINMVNADINRDGDVDINDVLLLLAWYNDRSIDIGLPQ